MCIGTISIFYSTHLVRNLHLEVNGLDKNLSTVNYEKNFGMQSEKETIVSLLCHLDVKQFVL